MKTNESFLKLIALLLVNVFLIAEYLHYEHLVIATCKFVLLQFRRLHLLLMKAASHAGCRVRMNLLKCTDLLP